MPNPTEAPLGRLWLCSPCPTWVRSGRCVRFTPESRHWRPSITWSALCHVWTAPCWQGLFARRSLVGAAMMGWTAPLSTVAVDRQIDSRRELGGGDDGEGHWAGYCEERFSGARRERRGRSCSPAKAAAL